MRIGPAQVKSVFMLLIEQENAMVLTLGWGLVTTSLTANCMQLFQMSDTPLQQQQDNSYIDPDTLDSARASGICCCGWFHDFVVGHLGS